MKGFVEHYGWSLVGYTGIALIGAGTYLMHPPSALIVVGALLFGMALASVLRRRP